MLEELLIKYANYFSQYGLAVIFTISFIGSTIFIPLSVEVFIGLLLGLGFNPWYLLIFATLGSTLGSLFNYFLGKLIDRKIIAKWRRNKDIRNLKRFVDRYGTPGLVILLALPLPLPVDIVTIFLGISEMDLKLFTAAVVIGKFIHYLFYIGIVNVII